MKEKALKMGTGMGLGRDKVVLVVALVAKALFPLFSMVAFAGWVLWFLGLYGRREETYRGMWRNSAWAFLLTGLSGVFYVLFFASGEFPEGLEGESLFLSLALLIPAYSLGLGASWFYVRVLFPLLGRWAYLWMVASALFPLGIPLHTFVRLWAAYRLVRGSEDKGQNGGHGEGLEGNGVPVAPLGQKEKEGAKAQEKPLPVPEGKEAKGPGKEDKS